VAIHCQELHEALEKRAAEISPEVKAKFSSNVKYLCKAMGVDTPFLPLTTPESFCLYTKLIIEMKGFKQEARRYGYGVAEVCRWS